MRLSFVVPAYNEETYLPACLESIRLQTQELGDDVEIIVVNNASTDRTREVALQYPGVRVVRSFALEEEEARRFALTNADYLTKSLRLARPLEPGFVMTVEPGLYFIPELMRRWRAERKFLDFIDYDRLETFADFGGVRIEEDLLVTADGYRILGKSRPRTIAEVEAVRA